MITKQEYEILRNKYDTYHAARKALCGNRNYVTVEDQALLPESPTSDEISAIEVYEFVNDIPDKYFLYVDTKKNVVTTWTGEKLGNCHLGYKYTSNMGDTRQSIYVKAINGKNYSGTYFTSSGDYARIKLCK